MQESKRLGTYSFDELVGKKNLSIDKDIETIKEQIDSINQEIIKLEHKATKEYRESVKNKLSLKQKELEAHVKNKPEEVPNPNKDAKIKRAVEIQNKKIENNELPRSRGGCPTIICHR